MARSPAEALVLLALLCSVIDLSAACGGHDHDDHWSKTIEVNGRRRTLLSMHGRRCGTDAPTEEEVAHVEEKHANHMRKEAFEPGSGPNGERVYDILTYVHIVMSDDGTKIGDVSDATVKAQLKLMNDAYAVNAKEYGVIWNFKLASIERVVGPSMCDKANEQKIKAANRKGGAGALNLYFTDLGECGLLGYSTWPWQAKDLVNDGVVIHFDTLPDGKEAPYNMGRTSIHETGHWMGLYHTFQNGCVRGGDMIADTPFTSGPTQGCPAARDSCTQPGADPIHNYMDYSDDNCMHQFSLLQHERMEGQFRQYRSA